MATTARPPSGRPGSSMPSSNHVARPGTASRLAAQAAANSKPPPTAAARPGTGRGGGVNPVPGGVNGPERLRTGRSLQSARGRGGIRNTRDRAYFIGALRSKLSEIINETNRLKNESKDFSALRDLSATTHGEYEALVKVVTELRGTQHDYEAMLESFAKGITNDDIQSEIKDLQQQNVYLTTEVQELLNERESREEQLKKLQDRAKKYETAGEALLREMSEEDQARYREMQRELELQTEIEERLLNEYETIKNGDRAKLEEELVFSPLKKEAAQVYSRIRDLQSTLDDLKEQTGRSPEQEQLRLLEKIKSEQAEITALERQSHTLQDVRETIQQQLGGRRTSTSTAGAGQRDAERHVFLANYREQQSELTNVLRKSQEENLRLLDQLSRNVAALNELPISTEADLMKSGQQLRSTVGQVKQEQRMREDLLQMNADERGRELRKLEALSETLTVEKNQRLTDLAKWEQSARPGVQSDMKTFLENQDQELKKELKSLEGKKRSLQDSLAKSAGNLLQRRTSLENNSFHQKILTAETQLRQILEQTYALDEAVAESTAGGSFEEQKLAVLQKAKQLNDLLKQLAQLDRVAADDY